MPAWLLLALLGQTPCQDCPAAQLPAVISSEARTDDTRPDRPTKLDLSELARRRAATHVAEALSELPGVVARPRYNEAQDAQIQIRGFGARSPFGVRGLRIEYDGIPATAADGQSQIGHIDIANAGELRLIRGPFAALYGNGGAYLRIDSERRRPGGRMHAAVGSSGQDRFGFELGGGEKLRLTLTGNRYHTDGARAHSAAERTLLAGRADFEFADSMLQLSAHYQDQPDSQDPQGLTRAEFANDPRSASPLALLFDTRKSTRQAQVGARYQYEFADSQLSLATYLGQRSVDQVLSVSIAAQAQAGNGGGIVDLQRDYSGWSLQWNRRMTWRALPAVFSAEWRVERLDEDRLGFENFVADQLGVRGVLRRDENSRGRSEDLMLRLDVDPHADLRFSAGARYGTTTYRNEDRYIAPGNPDDSGVYRDAQWLPVLGASYRVTDHWSWHSAIGRSQEVPTLAELAYRDGAGGFNTTLRPARARQAETGLRYVGPKVRSELTAFDINVADEIVVASSSGGRTSFQNAGATRRRGLEFAADWRFHPWRVRGVANWISARYSEGYGSCAAAPCAGPQFIVDAGTRLPGVAARSGRVEWAYEANDDWGAGLEWQALSATPASDRNRDLVPGYAIFNLRFNKRFRVAGFAPVEALLRLDNLFDRRYSASFIVNEAARRYFESAPGRSLWLGINIAL